MNNEKGYHMFKNNLKIALRNILNHKGYSLINIAGLALGITVCILIFLYVEYELGFDSHLSNTEQIYRVVTHTHRPEGTEYDGCTPFPTAAAMRNDFPILSQATQIYKERNVMITADKNRFKEPNILFIEPEFFQIFDIQCINGDAATALENPNSVILTEQLAQKYFGNLEVLGQVLNLDNEIDLIVTGVVTNPQSQTSLPYNMLISWKTMDEYYGASKEKWDFVDGNSYTFLLFPENIDPKILEEQFDAFEKKYMDPSHAQKWSLRLQPFSDIHFSPRYGSYNYVTSKKALFAFSAIGLVILLIACFNFINLTTAQIMKRTKEVGLRKVLGADRIQLIRQFLGETSLFIFFSVLIALSAAWIVLPYLNQFLGNNTELRFFSSNGIILFLGGVFLFVTLFNGLYPSLTLSRYCPAEALKKQRASRRQQHYLLRNSLVLLQFVVSQMLIVGTLVIMNQMRFMANMDLGYRKDSMVTVQIPEYEESRCETLRSRWLQNPHIKNVSFAWSAPTSQSNATTTMVYEESGSSAECPVDIKMCDKRYLEIFDIPLLAGHFFERNAGDENNKQWVVNEAVVAKMGLSDPHDAIGKIINVNDGDGEIIGVFRNFHVYSLHNEVQPTVFFNFWPQNNQEAQIKMDMIDAPETIEYIKGIWEENYPEYLFEYTFLDDFVNGLYETEARLLTMIQGASFLAILIGCLGLLGLAAFIAEQRTKEIGIRRVLGASVNQVVFLTSNTFIKMVLVANFIAWPIAYFLLNHWLQNFAYRIDLSIWIFILSGSLAFCIALVTVGYQSIKAALTNPVESLRYE